MAGNPLTSERSCVHINYFQAFKDIKLQTKLKELTDKLKNLYK